MAYEPSDMLSIVCFFCIFLDIRRYCFSFSWKFARLVGDSVATLVFLRRWMISLLPPTGDPSGTSLILAKLFGGDV